MNITIQVMAFTDVSPGHHDAIKTVCKTTGYESRIDAAGAHHTYHAYRWRILYP